MPPEACWSHLTDTRKWFGISGAFKGKSLREIHLGRLGMKIGYFRALRCTPIVPELDAPGGRMRQIMAPASHEGRISTVRQFHLIVPASEK